MIAENYTLIFEGDEFVFNKIKEHFDIGLFKRMFLTSVIQFIIPWIVLTTLFAILTTNNYNKERLSFNMAAIANSKELLDTQLSNINSLTYILGHNDAIHTFSSGCYSTITDKNFAAREVSREIINVEKYRGNVSATFLFFPKHQSIIGQNVIYSIKEFYDMILTDISCTFDEYKFLLQEYHESNFFLSFEQKNKIVIIRSLSNSSIENNVVLISIVDMKSIASTYRKLTKSLPPSYIVVISSHDDILAHSSDIPAEIDLTNIESLKTGSVERLSSSYSYICTKSVISNLYYVSVFSKVLLYKYIYLILISFVVAILLCSALTTASAYFTSKRYLSPFAALLCPYESAKSQNEFDLNKYRNFQDLIYDVLNSNTNLFETVSKQKKFINNNSYTAFLQDSMNMQDEDIQLLFDQTNKQFRYNYYQAAVFEFHSGKKFKDDEIIYALLDRIRDISVSVNMEYIVIPTRIPQTVFLFNHNFSLTNQIHKLFESVLFLFSQNEIELHIGLGRIVSSLRDFTKSYEDAIYSLMKNDDNYDAVKGRNQFEAFFTKEQKSTLLNAVIAGDVDGVNDFFNSLISTLFDKELLTFRVLNYVRFYLVNTLIELLTTLNLKDSHGYLIDCTQQTLVDSNHKNSFNVLKENFVILADFNKNSKLRSNDVLKDKMLEYIDMHCTDPDISLSSLAEQMNTSYTYMCKFFKLQTGRVFLDYLHERRIEIAKKMLCDTDLPITVISVKCGYVNHATFMRIFKKYVSVSPTLYRQNKKR